MEKVKLNVSLVDFLKSPEVLKMQNDLVKEELKADLKKEKEKKVVLFKERPWQSYFIDYINR